MHFGFICRHDPVLAAAEVALHVEKEVKAAGKPTLQCSKHPYQVLHAHTDAPLFLSRSMQSRNFNLPLPSSILHSPNSPLPQFSTPPILHSPFTASIIKACCPPTIAVQVNNMYG